MAPRGRIYLNKHNKKRSSDPNAPTHTPKIAHPPCTPAVYGSIILGSRRALRDNRYVLKHLVLNRYPCMYPGVALLRTRSSKISWFVILLHPCFLPQSLLSHGKCKALLTTWTPQNLGRCPSLARRDHRKSKFELRHDMDKAHWALCHDEVRILIFDRMTEN